VAAEVVADLELRGHVDDAAFARHWVEARAPRGYGPARLRAELRGRGVPAALIEAALDARASTGDLDRARTLARARLTALRRTRPDRAAARLRDHLLRRGYSGSIVARVVRELLDVTIDD
jgi:regulatory protein